MGRARHHHFSGLSLGRRSHRQHGPLVITYAEVLAGFFAGMTAQLLSSLLRRSMGMR